MPKQVSRFLVVGALAYTLDISVFLGLTELWQVPAEPARLSSFVITVLITYVLNGKLTFQAQLSRLGLGKYVAVQIVGSALNLGFFWLAIRPEIAMLPLIALSVGAALGSTFNFIAMRKLVFNDIHQIAD